MNGRKLTKATTVLTLLVAIYTPNTVLAEDETKSEVDSFPNAATIHSQTTIVDNSTGFTSGWVAIRTDSNLVNVSTFDQTVLRINSAGSTIDSAGFHRDGIPLIAGNHYVVSFDAASTINRSIELTMTNNNNGHVFISQSVLLNENQSHYAMEFDAGSESSFNGNLSLFTGNDGSIDIDQNHVITISNLRIEPTNPIHAVRVNQIGYQTYDQKRCTFTYDAGDFFDVINEETGETVYTGAILNKQYDPATGEVNSYGDFSKLQEPGRYYVRSQIGVSSYAFNIADQVYSSVRDELIHALSLQRCGETLTWDWASWLSHDSCHTSHAVIYGTNMVIDVSGGWHDAGDYGRYIKTGAKTVTDLLIAYQSNPESFTDACRTADSGNGIPDLLDEARYELEWMAKMQDPEDGGVYSKVLPANVSYNVLPEQDWQTLYVINKGTSDTADFAATMAFASTIFARLDPEFANQCFEHSVQAYAYLQANPDVIDYENPSGINGGNYRDSIDSDARFFTAMALWNQTQEESYLKDAKALFEMDPTCAKGTSWATNGAYGTYLFLNNSNAVEADSELYNQLLDSLFTEANGLLDASTWNGYNTTLTGYVWGSNGFCANDGILLAMTNQIRSVPQYRATALQQVDYLMGRNSLDLCFITGFGTSSPRNIHSRVALASGGYLKGALVGGPDALREDKITRYLSYTVPDAKVYVDTFESFTTNEITVYWNGALINLLALTS